MTEAEQLQALRNAVYVIVNSLGGALPRTPELQHAMYQLVAADMDASVPSVTEAR